MPYAPRRGCAYGKCKQVSVPGSQYCEEHKKLMDQQYNRFTRTTDTQKKYGRVWKRIRNRYAREHPLCEKCLAEGRITQVDEVHHIIPVSKGGTHDEGNLMSLCRSCHTKIHHEIGDRYSVTSDKTTPGTGQNLCKWCFRTTAPSIVCKNQDSKGVLRISSIDILYENLSLRMCA